MTIVVARHLYVDAVCLVVTREVQRDVVDFILSLVVLQFPYGSCQELPHILS